MDIVPFGIGSQNPGYCTILVLDHRTLDIAPFGIGSHKRGYCGIWQSITAGKHLQSGRLEGNPELGREDLEQVASLRRRFPVGGKTRPRLPTIPAFAVRLDQVFYQ